jgi:hypothetical protein
MTTSLGFGSPVRLKAVPAADQPNVTPALEELYRGFEKELLIPLWTEIGDLMPAHPRSKGGRGGVGVAREIRHDQELTVVLRVGRYLGWVSLVVVSGVFRIMEESVKLAAGGLFVGWRGAEEVRVRLIAWVRLNSSNISSLYPAGREGVELTA